MSGAARRWRLLGVAVLIVLAGCASRPRTDGPGSRAPSSFASIPDAVPRIEHPAPANFRPYSVFGVRYVPLAENQPYRKQGIASWYGRKFHGEKTANGETYDMYAMTAAHTTLPLPSYARVTRVDTGQSIVVRVNDRGPFHNGRIIDLSYAAAGKLGLIGPGSGRVVVQAITNQDIRAGLTGAAPRLAAQDAAPPPSAPSPTEPMATAVPVALSQRVQEREDTPAPAPAPTPPSSDNAVTAAGYYLQFGAFSAPENAQAFAERVNHQAGHLLPAPASVYHQAALYKVRSGPFNSRAAADATAGQLTQSADLRPMVASDQGI